jgi:outer membrane protein assembly factor BamE (lipoprotein component of BamABCDE complex)
LAAFIGILRLARRDAMRWPAHLACLESLMSVISARMLMGVALGLATIATGACSPLKGHQGYVLDIDLINSVQPGVDTRQSVLQVLGKPSFTSEFNQGDWYYVARDTRNFAYNKPKVTNQTTLIVSFDTRGVVSGVRRTGKEEVASISPYGKVTPTLGRKRSLFDELFGNIGTVGAAGTGGADQGGGRDTP